MGIVTEQAAFQSQERFLTDLDFQLFRRQQLMRPKGAYGFDSFVRNACPVEAIHDHGKHEVSGRGPLQVIEKKHRFHAGATEVLNLSRPDGLIEGSFDLRDRISDRGGRRPIPARYDGPLLGQ
jgi:hypothetical protein